MQKIAIYDDELCGFIFQTEIYRCIKEQYDEIRLCSFPTREEIEYIVNDPDIDIDNIIIGYSFNSLEGIWAYDAIGKYTVRVNNTTEYVCEIPSGPAHIIIKKVI